MTNNIEQAVQSAAVGYALAEAGDSEGALTAMAQGAPIEDLVFSNIEQADPDALRALVAALALDALDAGEHDAVLGLLLKLAKFGVTLKQLELIGLF